MFALYFDYYTIILGGGRFFRGHCFIYSYRDRTNNDFFMQIGIIIRQLKRMTQITCMVLRVKDEKRRLVELAGRLRSPEDTVIRPGCRLIKEDNITVALMSGNAQIHHNIVILVDTCFISHLFANHIHIYTKTYSISPKHLKTLKNIAMYCT